jgi:hypothetical protein
MNLRTVNSRSALFTAAVFLSAALLIMALGGCAAPTTGPGTPDALQQQHYEMLKSAIDAKSKNDALAALKLLETDVHRWQANTAVIAITMHDQNALTDAVNKEDWARANKLLLSLNAKYGHPK